MQNIQKTVSLLLIPVTSIVLIAFQSKTPGFIILTLGLISLFPFQTKYSKNILLIYIGLAILGISPINTSIHLFHMLSMGTLLILAIALPYYISRHVYKDHAITYRFHHGRSWTQKEIMYIFVTAIISYLLFPFALRETSSYLNWTVEPGIANLVLLFIGTNALGIWDELFFINTVLGLLKRHLTFPKANVLQAVLFTSFLYELGFRGWLWIIIFLFALLQGYIFKKTDSLLYIITIHLTADLILYLALIYLHHPGWFHFFIT